MVDTPTSNSSHFGASTLGLQPSDHLGRFELRKVLGDRFVDVYAAIKDLEHQEFMTVISPWEREHLLLHV